MRLLMKVIKGGIEMENQIKEQVKAATLKIIEPIGSYCNRISSYGLKHEIQERTGIYVRDEAMKEILSEMGLKESKRGYYPLRYKKNNKHG